jgi:hypothetical protein
MFWGAATVGTRTTTLFGLDDCHPGRWMRRLKKTTDLDEKAA